MRSRVCVLTGLVVLLLGGLAAPEAAAAPAPSLVVSLSSSYQAGYPSGRQLAWDSTNATTLFNGSAQSITVAAGGGVAGGNFGFSMTAGAGQSLHVGSYDLDFSTTVADVSLDSEDQQSSSSAGFIVDIRDLALDTHDRIARLDLLYRSPAIHADDSWFGEIRYAEPGPADHLVSATTLQWPLVPVTGHAVSATDWIHNTSDHALSIASPSIIGSGAAAFRLASNGCTANPLPPRAACPVVIAFAPTTPGPHPATLHLLVGTTTDNVTLQGVAPTGYTGLITSGNDYVDGGATHTFPDGAYQTYALAGPWGGQFSVEKPFDPSFNDYRVLLNAPRTITPGTYPVTDIGPRDAYQLAVYGNGRGCSFYTGTMTVKQYQLDTAHHLLAADIRFALSCGDDQSGTAPTMTGELSYRATNHPTLTQTRPRGTVTPGVLVSLTGHAPAGATVTLSARPTGAARYTTVRTITTGLSGLLTYSYHARATTTFHATIQGTTGPALTVHVKTS